ncbi:MAG: HAD-IIIA family hydrolase [Magnetococcales bacterium]|nr:HAD-IIIA family hydrolase [Magnetococcales bacterium]
MSLSRPKQAVILAGGRGTRLAPLTDHCPKPMIPFHGRPFLEYLIELLRTRGFDRILLLLGYLSDQIISHFGDGSRFGVTIQYHVTPVEDDTGSRVRKALPHIEPLSLLLYCDNYWPIPWEQLWQQFVQLGTLAQVTVYANRDGYSRDNMCIGPNNLVTIYDKTRQSTGLQGVDIGFLIAHREIFEQLPEENCSLEKEIYPQLVRNQQLAAFLTEHRYYSVGDLRRLPLTEQFLARQPAVILDRDGVLNQRMPRAHYVRHWDEWHWLPGALDALRQLRDNGFLVVIITNQAGVARGAMTLDDLQQLHQRMQVDVRQAGGHIDAIYYCPHDWNEGCFCRKPQPGMLFQAQRDFHLDLSRTWFLGDDERDGEAARQAAMPFGMVDPDHPLVWWINRLCNRL